MGWGCLSIFLLALARAWDWGPRRRFPYSRVTPAKAGVHVLRLTKEAMDTRAPAKKPAPGMTVRKRRPPYFPLFSVTEEGRRGINRCDRASRRPAQCIGQVGRIEIS